jgi:hypothetical protein
VLRCAVLCCALVVRQDGSQLRLSEADRKALVFGLALHEKGKVSLQAGHVQVRQPQLQQAYRTHFSL